MKNLKFILIAAIVFSISSCCSCRKSASTATSFTETRWGLVNMQGRTIERKDNFFLVFSKDGNVAGRGDCNSIGGGYTAGDGMLKFGPMRSTRMFCPDQETENNFTLALESVNGYSIDGNTLMLMRDGDIILVFEAE